MHVPLALKTESMAFSIQLSGNESEQAFLLKDEVSGVTAEIYRLGALLNSFCIPFEGSFMNVIDGFDSPATAATDLTPAFKSARLSPFTCRLHHGQYNFDGKAYTIEKFYLPPHAIHGIIFDVVYDVVSTHADEDSASVTLRYRYAGSDAGYPFSYASTVHWELKPAHQLTVTTTVNNEEATPIPLADGWHPYFKLDKGVNECTLQFDGASLIEFDNTLIPTGKVITDNRFTEGQLLGDTFLDNCFALDPLTENPACVLSTEKLKLTISPDRSYPYLQVYTPAHRQSIAIENLSAPPDAFNNGIGLLLAEKGKPAIFSTTYRVETI